MSGLNPVNDNLSVSDRSVLYILHKGDQLDFLRSNTDFMHLNSAGNWLVTSQ